MAAKLDFLRDRRGFALRMILAEVLGAPRGRVPHRPPQPLPPPPPPREKK